MTGLKLLTLNIESDRHLDRIHAAIATHVPDIVCFQEALESSLPRLAAIAGYDARFGASLLMPSRDEPARLRDWGVAVLTRSKPRRQTVVYYADDPSIRVFDVPNDARRLLIVTELDHEGRVYTIGTTHFTWTPDGHINDEQRADFVRLEQALRAYPDYVLCGDFNAPRGREMFAKFTDQLGLIDHLPSHITTTIDPSLHYMGSELQLVVDTIFSTPEYRVTDVQVLEGVSDHKGILARIERL